jgi:hypothetical protein
MRRSHPGSFRRPAALLRHQFLQGGGLPFTDVLTDQVLAAALAAVGHWLDRVFSPLVTLWVFLGQVLSADHSCRAAVARLLAHRLAHGRRPCPTRTGAYCRARGEVTASHNGRPSRGLRRSTGRAGRTRGTHAGDSCRPPGGSGAGPGRGYPRPPTRPISVTTGCHRTEVPSGRAAAGCIPT